MIDIRTKELAKVLCAYRILGPSGDSTQDDYFTWMDTRILAFEDGFDHVITSNGKQSLGSMKNISNFLNECNIPVPQIKSQSREGILITSIRDGVTESKFALAVGEYISAGGRGALGIQYRLKWEGKDRERRLFLVTQGEFSGSMLSIPDYYLILDREIDNDFLVDKIVEYRKKARRWDYIMGLLAVKYGFKRANGKPYAESKGIDLVRARGRYNEIEGIRADPKKPIRSTPPSDSPRNLSPLAVEIVRGMDGLYYADLIPQSFIVSGKSQDDIVTEFQTTMEDLYSRMESVVNGRPERESIYNSMASLYNCIQDNGIDWVKEKKADLIKPVKPKADPKMADPVQSQQWKEESVSYLEPDSSMDVVELHAANAVKSVVMLLKGKISPQFQKNSIWAILTEMPPPEKSITNRRERAEESTPIRPARN